MLILSIIGILSICLLKNKNETYINYLKYLSNNLEFKISHNKNDEELNLAKKTLERINKYLYEH